MTQGQGGKPIKETGNHSQVVDFAEVRERRLEEKRRKNERIFFKNLLSVYTVVGDSKILPIELIDVSEEGCSFQLPHDTKRVWPNDANAEIPLRLYFSQDTYLEVFVKIMNSRPCIENQARYIRYGCVIDPSTTAYPAYQQFVRFLKLYSEASHKDNGGVTVFYI